MEQILFRGQTRRKGEKCRLDGTPVDGNWVFGGVLQGTGNHSIIYQTEPEIAKKVVYTDTLGMFTGIVDKNDVKVFEGDLVEYNGKVYTIVYRPKYARFFAVRPNASFCVSALTYGVVIGNIYDNPELVGTTGVR